jgi:hypothetical protein
MTFGRLSVDHNDGQYLSSYLGRSVEICSVYQKIAKFLSYLIWVLLRARAPSSSYERASVASSLTVVAGED